MVTRLALVLTLGCSSKARPPGDATAITPTEAGARPADAAGSAAAGEAQITITWKAVPVAARSSLGPTPCHTPRAAAVAPTTMFGIPDAVVIVEGVTATPAEARIVVADCALSPRVVVGEKLIVESALDRPAKLALSKHGDVGHLEALAAGPARAIQFPIAGHAVAIPLDPGGVYRLTIDGPGDFEPAWIVAAPAVVTDLAGQATVRAGSGPHAVTTWLPARGGQAGKLIKSSVAVEAGTLVEHAIDLAP